MRLARSRYISSRYIHGCFAQVLAGVFAIGCGRRFASGVIRKRFLERPIRRPSSNTFNI
jgi:hypothetical protein